MTGVMMTKKYDVHIFNVTHAPTSLSSILGSPMSMPQVEKYLQQLSKKHMPCDSCIDELRAYFTNKDDIKLSLSGLKSSWRAGNAPIKKTENHSASFSIYLTLMRPYKCKSEDCLDNIKNGTCRDKLVIDLIGKKFFAEKYNDVNEKQR